MKKAGSRIVLRTEHNRHIPVPLQRVDRQDFRRVVHGLSYKNACAYDHRQENTTRASILPLKLVQQTSSEEAEDQYVTFFTVLSTVVVSWRT